MGSLSEWTKSGCWYPMHINIDIHNKRKNEKHQKMLFLKINVHSLPIKILFRWFRVYIRTPPNWNEHITETIMSGSPYKLFRIFNDTKEFGTLAALRKSIKIMAHISDKLKMTKMPTN